jgi:ribosomal protein S19
MRDYKFFIPDPRFLIRTTRVNFDLSKPIFSRSTLVTDVFVGKKAFIHDGHQFRFIFIKPEHLFYPVGSFIFTKKTGIRIHTNKSKKDKKKL